MCGTRAVLHQLCLLGKAVQKTIERTFKSVVQTAQTYLALAGSLLAGLACSQMHIMTPAHSSWLYGISLLEHQLQHSLLMCEI